MTQDVNPSVMERPLLAQRLGPHGPLPRRNIHQRVRTPSRPAPEMSHQHQQRCGERSCRDPGGGAQGGNKGALGPVFEDQGAEIKRRMSDGRDLKPTSPPSASTVITTLTGSVQKKYGQGFLSCTLHQKPWEGKWEVGGLCLFSRCIVSLVFQLPPSKTWRCVEYPAFRPDPSDWLH